MKLSKLDAHKQVLNAFTHVYKITILLFLGRRTFRYWSPALPFLSRNARTADDR